MATYYVGPGGNDANNGTSWALRKLTLNGAEDIPVEAADTVYVGPGVYRELLTVDVSGSAGNPITYIGDYTGANTDGTGGVVRITGSENNQTATRTEGITGSNKAFRVFRGFVIDLTSASSISLIGNVASVTIEDCVLSVVTTQAVAFVGEQSACVVRRCYLLHPRGGYGITFSHSSTVSDTGNVVENCISVGGYGAEFVRSVRVGGITVRNCTDQASEYGVRVQTALAEGQTITVNNCIFNGNRYGVHATAVGEITENYNTFWNTGAVRTNTNTGANSNTFPPLFDTRWFFEMVNGGSMVTPFDLASYSQLVNVAGTSPATADMRGTTVQGAQREWGPLEYDSTLSLADDDGADYPEAAEVLDTATFAGSTSGTYHAPEAAEVIDTAVFGVSSGTSGLVHQPDVAEVLDSAVFGVSSGDSGTYHAPDAGEVIDTATFGAASAETGTVHLPEAAEVIDTAVFGAASAVAGTYHEAEAAEVQLGVTFGPGETYTGTLAGGAADWTADEKEQIRMALGITGDTAATSGTGNLDTVVTAVSGLSTDEDIAAAVLVAMNLTPPAVNVTQWKGAAAPGAPATSDQVSALAVTVGDVQNSTAILLGMTEPVGEVDYRFTEFALSEAPSTSIDPQDIANAGLLAPEGEAAAGSQIALLAGIDEDTGTTLPAAIGGQIVEDTHTRDDLLRILAAALAGETSGSGTAAVEFLGLDGVTTRIAATVSEDGNRTAIVLDGEA